MSPIPPLSVEVSTRRRACVVDTDLALSKDGLPVITRICDEFDTWVSPQLFRILDETEIVRSHIGRNSCEQKCIEQTAELQTQFIGDILSIQEVAFQWETARIEADIAGLNIYWMGDEKSESLLPKHKHVDQSLVQRFRVLTRSLDNRLRLRSQSVGKKGVKYLPALSLQQVSYPELLEYECFRDTAALAAALAPMGSFILTRNNDVGQNKDPKPHESKIGERHARLPKICKRLEAWGIASPPYKPAKMYAVERDYWAPVWVRTGMTELMHAGLRLAMVHLIVPNAVVIPSANQEGEELPATEQDINDHWWDGAQAFWYPLEFQ